MINFNSITRTEFLTNYWQKKPLVIRQALPDFSNPLSPDELAGLAMEDEIESRIVSETKGKAPHWHLQRGPFSEKDFNKPPKTHWTLLVQGVDRFLPEVASLLDHFDFIPQWRVDDVMISYATKQGSVGPHYDNYDVFLYQAQGRRKWLLTTKNCHQDNYLTDVDLRIMKQFEVEQEYILEEGDMLYLPAHVGHYGISLSDDCMTYSFGYRSYQAQELWDSFGEYFAEKNQSTPLYQDPNWSTLSATSELPPQAWQNAKTLMQDLLANENHLKAWFGCFSTRLDQQAEELLPMPLSEEEFTNRDNFIQELEEGITLARHPSCRFAYEHGGEELALFVNGCEWDIEAVDVDLVKLVANNRLLTSQDLMPFLKTPDNQIFLFELWKLQWLELVE